MPHKFNNSSKSKKVGNKKVITTKLIKVNKKNSDEIINNDNIENNIKEEIEIKNQKKEEELNLDLINQKYKDINDEDNINNIFDYHNNNQNEEIVSYNNEEEKDEKEEINNNYRYYNESIPDDYDNEYNNYLNNIEDENENNKLNNDIKTNDNIKIDENIEKSNIDEEDININNDEDENKEIENNFNNIEIEEIEADEFNEKYSLPLAIEHEKNKEIASVENKINNNENNIELNNNNLLKQENELINDQENNSKNINEIDDIEEIKIKNSTKEKDINNNNILNTKNEKNIVKDIKQKIKDNIEEDYEDYILNTLAKLKKNNIIKPNKENKLFNLLKYVKKENNKADNIYNPIIKLVKSDKNVTPRNNSIDDIIINKDKINSFDISPINNSYTALEKKINQDKYNPIKINNTIQLFLEKELRKEKEKKIEIPEGVKFGIDETGNPLNISQFIDEENNEKEKNKLIAYIIQQKDEKNKNYLVDKKGKILEKTKEGDYLYKDGETYIVIKDFDVQHPELRIYGHRSYTSSENRMLSEKVTIDNKDDKRNNNNNNKMELKDILNNKYRKYLKEMNNNNYINSNNHLNELRNKIIDSSSSGSFVNNDYNLNKINTSHSFLKGNDEFKNLMTVWRKRYGNKNAKINTAKIPINYSYSVRRDDRMVQRTNSILKMTSERNKKDFIFKTDTNNEISQINYIRQYPRLTITKKYNIPIYSNGIINKKYENPLLKKKGTSFSKSNNPLLKNKNILLRNNIEDIPQIKMNTEKWLYKNGFNTNKTFEYMSFNNEDKNIHTRSNMFKNFFQKNKDITINKGHKTEIINDYIYKNITKINSNKNNNFKKKNILDKKYSILSNEANKLVKDYYIKQSKKGKIINHDNILINKTFNFNTNFVPKRNKNLQNNKNHNIINKNKLNAIDNNILKSVSYSKINKFSKNNNDFILNFERNKNVFN